MPLLRVDPAGYTSAATMFGDLIAGLVRGTYLTTLDELSNSHGMAGTDSGGAQWADSYDHATASIAAGSENVIKGCYQLAALLTVTGLNHDAANSASAAGSGPSVDVNGGDYATESISLPAPVSAHGGSSPAPHGWSMVQHAVGYVWPNGHQDKLHAAAGVWAQSARSITEVAYHVAPAVSLVREQVSPEVDACASICSAMGGHLHDLSAAYNDVSSSCNAYANHLDQAHAAIGHELNEFVIQTAAIEAGGALLSIVTAGAAEIAAQAVEIARIAATGSRIALIITRLIDAVGETIELITSAVTRITSITDKLKALLAAPLIKISPAFVPKLVAAVKDGKTAEDAEATAVDAAKLAKDALPADVRANVDDAIERARTGKIRFTKHDGKDYDNWNHQLPPDQAYTEWTAAPAGAPRGADRVIIAGDTANPTAIYYWDHVNPPVRIGP